MKLIPVIFLKNNSILLFIYDSFHCYFFEKKIYPLLKQIYQKIIHTIPYHTYYIQKAKNTEKEIK